MSLDKADAAFQERSEKISAAYLITGPNSMNTIPAMQTESDKTDLAGLSEPSSNQTHLKQISSNNPSPLDKTDQSQDIKLQLHRHRMPDPYTQANCLSRLFFHWPYALLRLGMQQTIQEQDLPEISKYDSSQYNLLWFEQMWNQELMRVKTLEKTKKTITPFRPSLQRAVVLNYLKSTWFIQPLLFVSVFARIVQAFSLGYLIQSMAEKSSAGYIWATVLALCTCYLFFQHHHVFFITYRKGMQLRSAAIAAVFSKSLRLSSIHGMNGISSGQVMNLVSNDVERLILAAYYGPFVIWGPVFGIGSLISGIQIIGPSFAAGFGLLICIFIPLQFYFSQRFSQLRSNVAILTDARVTLLSQAILGIRVMKMNGWENDFENRLAEARTAEISQILKTSRLMAWNQAISFACNVVISATVFIVHVGSGGVLSARSVFSTITLINAIQYELTKNFSYGVVGVSEGCVSLRRIQAYLETPELDAVINEASPPSSMSDSSIGSKVLLLDRVTCYWNSNTTMRESTGVKDDRLQSSISDEDESPTLEQEKSNALNSIALSNITVDFEMSSITFIIGMVGSGKSALLQALMGELPVANGRVERRYKSLAYSPQDPWIMNGTIRENILMGLPVNESFYEQVVSSCSLSYDFSLFLNGDQTFVGDRGVQLSGGQRARISLARALYRDSDLILLDDPLSAVDAKVGRLIFYSAIQGLCLKRGKAVILVTHQHQFIGDSRCILMSGGKIAHVGSLVDSVSVSDGKLNILMQSSNVSDDDITVLDENISLITTDLVSPKAKDNHADNSPTDTPMLETKASGGINRGAFVSYFRAVGGCVIVVTLLALFTVTQASALFSLLVMGHWAQRTPIRQEDASLIGLVVGLSCTVLTLSITRSLAAFARTIRASQKLHDEMTKSVLRATIEFFDVNPSGRILNRFSSDVGSNDDTLPFTLFEFLSTSFMTLGAIVTCIVVLPFTLVVFPPLLWYFLRSRSIYVITSRELKRLEGIARSPIYSMLNESYHGIATIRTNDAVGFFREKFDKLQNCHSRAFFASAAGTRWVGFRMDSIMFVVTTAACYLAVLFNQQGWFKVDGVVLGLALTCLIQLSGLFQNCIRLSAEVVNAFTSVERVTEYSTLPSEPALVLESDASNRIQDWPRSGTIVVENLSVRYRPTLPLSLDDISFTIESGQHIGVVGRTGSGKSTLVQTFLRILEAENGTISIDGIDIASVGLHKLRREISVINQIPTLFSGSSIRKNLDPFGEYTDDQIRDALEDVQMIETINEFGMGMHSMVSEGGSNFSVGQRQLLCLARAILRKSKILILDEPTANVDMQTDALLQEAISKSFGGATIISVAHRLDTIIDYDMILVLGSGRILEYGNPHDLLNESSGHFTSLVEDTGLEMSQELRRRAHLGFEGRSMANKN